MKVLYSKLGAHEIINCFVALSIQISRGKLAYSLRLPGCSAIDAIPLRGVPYYSGPLTRINDITAYLPCEALLLRHLACKLALFILLGNSFSISSPAYFSTFLKYFGDHISLKGSRLVQELAAAV